MYLVIPSSSLVSCKEASKNLVALQRKAHTLFIRASSYWSFEPQMFGTKHYQILYLYIQNGKLKILYLIWLLNHIVVCLDDVLDS